MKVCACVCVRVVGKKHAKRPLCVCPARETNRQTNWNWNYDWDADGEGDGDGDGESDGGDGNRDWKERRKGQRGMRLGLVACSRWVAPGVRLFAGTCHCCPCCCCCCCCSCCRCCCCCCLLLLLVFICCCRTFCCLMKRKYNILVCGKYCIIFYAYIARPARGVNLCGCVWVCVWVGM